MTSVVDTGTGDDDDGLTDPLTRRTRRLTTQSIRRVFKVTYKDNQGTGAFYEVLDTSNCKRSLFITCNYVAPTNSLQDIMEFMKIVFPEDNSLLELKIEHLLCCWTWKCYCIDATVIELSTAGEKYLRDLNVTFLQVSDANVKDLVSILEISDGQSTKGYIKEVKESKVYYHKETAAGSVGAPLIDQNCRAFAIHRTVDPTNDDKLSTEYPDRPLMAIALREIIKAFFNESETL